MCGDGGKRSGFSLTELLAVISIITLLLGILAPALNKARKQAKTMLGLTNQRQIVNALNLYAADNGETYPESVATIGVASGYWNWQEPTMLTGYRKRSPQIYRAISGYLGSYISDAKIMQCINAPRKYDRLQQAWKAGDDWDNPETPQPKDPVIGTYCFWWNYIGWLGEEKLFRGPRNSMGEPGRSKLLVSCYLGYDHWRSTKSFGSCEKFNGAKLLPQTWVASAYWACAGGESVNLNTIDVKLQAGYIDGHVESFAPWETVPMKVSIRDDGSIPYPDGVGPGTFYLPKTALK
jgi:prepilin-type N-terminal cleavage/methylation domain-containing protein